MHALSSSPIALALRRVLTGSALPRIPSSASDGVGISRLYYGSLSLRPAELFAPLADLTRFFSPPATEAFTLQLPIESVTLLVVEYSYGGI